MRVKFFFPLFLVCILAGCGGSKPELNVYVDERVELTTIAFRLAGAEEWTNYDGLEYLDDIDEYFAPYKDHPLLSYIREIRDKYSIGYGYVVSIPFFFDIDGASFVLRDDNDYDLFVSNGWEYDSIIHFLDLLESFYYDTDFHSFFDAQAERIKTTIEYSRKKLSEVDFGWFKSFYGEGVQTIDCYVGMAMGSNNFGDINGSKNTTIFLGCLSEYLGAPILSDSAMQVSVHEINHK